MRPIDFFTRNNSVIVFCDQIYNAVDFAITGKSVCSAQKRHNFGIGDFPSEVRYKERCLRTPNNITV